MSESRVGEWFNLALPIAFFSAIFWLGWRSRRAKLQTKPVSDGPPGEVYRVYTNEFDRELAGHQLDRELLAASPDYAGGWFKLSKDQWRRDIHLADQLVSSERQSFANAMGTGSQFEGQAVTILIDQSGSMEGDPVRWTAVTCRLAAEWLTAHGCEVEVLGFSTAGWRGGFAYQKWQREGRPKRPGRLCALIHIVYKCFAQTVFDRADWEAMLNPNVLRENVDGEALEWAAGRLRLSQARQKALVMCSDGAAVDDATLMHNGISYLTRHLKFAISQIEAKGEIALHAISIGHDVSQYYGQSVTVEDLTQLPTTMANTLHKLGQWVGTPSQ